MSIVFQPLRATQPSDCLFSIAVSKMSTPIRFRDMNRDVIVLLLCAN